MHRRILVFAVLALVSMPAATATWYFAGSFEPSTSFDTDEWMWQDAHTGAGDRIYFAAFAQYLAATNPADFNPNVGALHTQIEVSNAEHHEVLLGVWKDCNGDGYIGVAESAMREYPEQLGNDLDVCPLVTGSALQWTPGAHNYNGWVSELIPIARDHVNASDKRVYPDDDARVWGDYHRPGEEPWIRQCVVAPQPRGTYQSTGGFLTYVDCRGDVLGAANLALITIGDPLGLQWSDTDDGSSGSLGQMETFGDEDDANRAVTVWDCDSATRAGDIINSTPAAGQGSSTVHNVEVYALAPDVEDTSDPNTRVAATVNHTVEGTDDCDTHGTGDTGGDVYEGTCGITVYCVGEGDRAIVDPSDKRVAAWNVGFVTAARGAAPWSALAPLRWNGPSGPPAMTDIAAWEGSRWQADSYWSTKPGFGTIRTHLHDLGNSEVEIAPAYWLTFYAYVSPTTTARGFQLPSDSVGTYGEEFCGEHESGIHSGWNCDVSLWNRNPDGSPIDDPGATDLEFHEMIVPGQKYQLRDVDCYDGTIRGTDPDAPLGVGVQPAYFGAEPCT